MGEPDGLPFFYSEEFFMSQHKTELWDEALGGALSAKYNQTAEYVPVIRSVNARLVEEIAPFRRLLVDGFEKFLTDAKGKIDYFGPSLEQFASWLQPNGNFKKTDFDIAVLSHTHTHFFWQYTRAEFEFEEEVMAHIIESETPTKIPASIIKQLPYWTQWVRAPIGVDIAGEPAASQGANLHFFGALVSYLRYDNKTFLNLNAPVFTERGDWKDPALMAANVRVCIDGDIDFTDPNTIIPYMQGTHENLSEEMKQKIFGAVREWAPKMISCVLFLCSQQEALYKQGAVQQAVRRKGNNYKMQALSKSKQFTVGGEFVDQIREYEADAMRSITGQRRAHIRRGHYHHFWTGPKAGERKLICKWLPPSVVRGTAEQ